MPYISKTKKKCIVGLCPSNICAQCRNSSDFSFHTVPPLDDSRREKWLTQCQRPELIKATAPKDIRVCSRHFSQNSYDSTVNRKILLQEAVPSLTIESDCPHNTGRLCRPQSRYSYTEYPLWILLGK